MKHQEKNHLFECLLCHQVFGRKYNASRHNHVHTKEATAVERIENNKSFIDPLGVLPYRVDHRQRLCKKRRRETEQTETSLVTETADCRDEVISYNKEGSMTGKTFKRSSKK